MVRKSNVWVGVRPLNSEPFHELREGLRPVLPSFFEPETDPHVTVVQCNLPTRDLEEMETKARRLALIGRTFEIDGFRCHPDALDPEVIVLDAEIDLSASREELAAFARERGGEVLGELPPPHVTLWKCRWDRTVEEETSERIAERMAEMRDEVEWEATIGDVEVSTF